MVSVNRRSVRLVSGLVVSTLAVFAIGCRGKVLASAELHGTGSASTHFTATTSKTLLWADTDAKWTGDDDSRPELLYEIDVLQSGKAVGHLSCTTGTRSGSAICGVSSNVMGIHSADCEYTLACKLPALAPGDVELQVTGGTGSNVIAVKKMSLNVRTN